MFSTVVKTKKPFLEQFMQALCFFGRVAALMNKCE